MTWAEVRGGAYMYMQCLIFATSIINGWFYRLKQCLCYHKLVYMYRVYMLIPFLNTCALQAYTSQFVALVMFALVMSEDRVSLQGRRKEIIEGLSRLSGEVNSKRGG